MAGRSSRKTGGRLVWPTANARSQPRSRFSVTHCSCPLARWWLAWSRDARAPRISHLVVIDIPTGNAVPIAQKPYPVAYRYKEAMKEEIQFVPPRLLAAAFATSALTGRAAAEAFPGLAAETIPPRPVSRLQAIKLVEALE